MISRRYLAVGLAASSLAGALLMPLPSTATMMPVNAVGTFVAVDRAAVAGLRVPSATTWSASTVDFNRDGAEDVLINFHMGKAAKLLKNRGAGHYRRVKPNAWPVESREGKPVDRHNCAWADVDRNGRPDAYCSAGRTEINYVKEGRDNELWLQSRSGRFREVGTRWHAGDVCARGRNVAFLDANGDRWPDLFVGNHTPRHVPDPCNRSDHPNAEGSKIFLNVRGQRFRHAHRFFDYGAGPGARCAEVLDFDGDGWDDLLACRDAGVTPRLYRNRHGHGFADVTARHTLIHRLNDATVADLDGDGDPDLVNATPAGFEYQLNRSGHFGPATPIARAAIGTGWGVAVGDADADGDGDIYGMVGRGLRRNPDDWVWLNQDLTFTQLRVPHAGGAADDVVTMHPQRTGRAAFLVLNGRKRVRSGPIQLIRVVRAP